MQIRLEKIRIDIFQDTAGIREGVKKSRLFRGHVPYQTTSC